MIIQEKILKDFKLQIIFFLILFATSTTTYFFGKSIYMQTIKLLFLCLAIEVIIFIAFKIFYVIKEISITIKDKARNFKNNTMRIFSNIKSGRHFSNGLLSDTRGGGNTTKMQDFSFLFSVVVNIILFFGFFFLTALFKSEFLLLIGMDIFVCWLVVIYFFMILKELRFFIVS